jgi:ketosteroid isomerase-like protein
MSRENVEVVRQLYAAINRGLHANAVTDEALTIVFDPEIEVRQLAALAGTAGTFHGYEGLRELQTEVDEALRDHRYEVAEHAAAGNKVGFRVKAVGVGRASGVPAELWVGHLFELADGRIKRWLVYANPEEALEAARTRGAPS